MREYPLLSKGIVIFLLVWERLHGTGMSRQSNWLCDPMSNRTLLYPRATLSHVHQRLNTTLVRWLRNPKWATPTTLCARVMCNTSGFLLVVCRVTYKSLQSAVIARGLLKSNEMSYTGTHVVTVHTLGKSRAVRRSTHLASSASLPLDLVLFIAVPTVMVVFVIIITRIKNIKNVTRCRDSRSAKSISETR